MTSQRVSRGFHRLGLFVAMISFLIGAAATLFEASTAVESARQSHEERVELYCARSYYAGQQSKRDLSLDEELALLAAGIKPGSLEAMFGKPGKPIFLSDIGCAKERGKTASPEAVLVATEPSPFCFYLRLPQGS